MSLLALSFRLNFFSPLLIPHFFCLLFLPLLSSFLLSGHVSVFLSFTLSFALFSSLPLVLYSFLSFYFFLYLLLYSLFISCHPFPSLISLFSLSFSVILRVSDCQSPRKFWRSTESGVENQGNIASCWGLSPSFWAGVDDYGSSVKSSLSLGRNPSRTSTRG